MSRKNLENPTLSKQLFSSFTGACVTSITMTPLDVIKVRLQIQARNKTINPLKKGDKLMCFNGLMDCVCLVNNGPKPNEALEKYYKRCWYYRPNHFTSGYDAFNKILRNEGVASLWSGTGTTILQSGFSVCFYFTLYEAIRDRFKQMETSSNAQTFFYTPLAGVIARTSTCILVNPIEIVRIRVQAEPQTAYLEQVKNLLRNRASWGSGLKMSIYRDAPFSAIYWMLNEIIREKLKDSQYLGSFSRSFIAGATAGSLAALLTTPFDVIKTRIQTDTTSSSLGNTSLIQFYHKEGLQSLFIGWQQRCLRTALACALMLGTYEFTKEQYNKHLTSEKS